MYWPSERRLGVGMAIMLIVALSIAGAYVVNAFSVYRHAPFTKSSMELDSSSNNYMVANMAEFFKYQPKPVKQEKTVSKVAVKPSAKTQDPTPPVPSSPIYGSPLEQQMQLWEVQAAQANAHGEYDRLAKCETNGNWQFRSRNYSGGIGIYNPAWDYFRLPGMADNAAKASKAEQIVVAERIRLEVPPKGSWAHGKWGCAGAAGLR